jgi:hypothetical protein
MRQLRFLTLTEDGDHALVETTDGAEQFTLAVDATLRDAVRADLPRLMPAPAGPALVVTPIPGSAVPADPGEPGRDEGRHHVAPPAAATARVVESISPREIQMRVRAGEDPAALAAESGMELERIMRFAGAVVAERLRIADEARRARARRTTGDAMAAGGTFDGGFGSAPSGDAEAKIVVFGEAVDERFGAHGIPADSVSWDSHRRDDGEWVVVATWLGGTTEHSAQWLFSRSLRTVTPLDDTAADLLSNRPIRPVAPPEPVRPALVGAPPLVRGVVAFPPMPDAHTGPLPPVDDVFDQEAPPEGPREVPPLVPAAVSMLSFDEPPLPLGIADPGNRPAAGTLRSLGNHRRDESDEERAARARIPSWDDILLGTRRKD